MGDIRSFFGGKPPVSSGSSQKEKKPDPKKQTPVKNSKKRKSRVIGKSHDALTCCADFILEDSDEDDIDKYNSPNTN